MKAAQALSVDDHGNILTVRQSSSPNQDARPPDTQISLLVIHGISLPPGQFGGGEIGALFCNRLNHSSHPCFEPLRGLRVSAHFLIGRDGNMEQFVPCTNRAWHAGKSSSRGRDQCNDFSIGVELEGADDVPYEPIQYEVLVHLVRALKARYPIDEIVAHSDIAPDRKTDPGPAFDWARFNSLMNS